MAEFSKHENYKNIELTRTSHGSLIIGLKPNICKYNVLTIDTLDELIDALKNNGDLSQLNENTETSKPITVADQIRDIISESGDGYRARTLECIVSAVCFLMIERYSAKASSMVLHNGKVKPIKIDKLALLRVWKKKR